MTWPAPAEENAWHELIVWARNRSIAVYIDKHPGIVWNQAELAQITRIAFQGEGPNGWQLDDLHILSPEPASTAFEGPQWPETWQRSAAGSADLFREQGKDNHAALLRAGSVTLDTLVDNVVFSCRYQVRAGGFMLRLRDSASGAYVLDLDGGHLRVLQAGSDGQTTEMGVYQWFYGFNLWYSLTVEMRGERLRVYQSGVLTHDGAATRPPGAGRIEFVLDGADTLWLDDCVVFQLP
ncbi:MAG: hypothetical protein M5R40_11925 [Anaerolineae bacterium]|nr:hypothetical protein [Anaerolineae bacterium]